MSCIVVSVAVLSGCSSPFSTSVTDVKTGETEVAVGNDNVSVKTGEGQVNIGGGEIAATDGMAATKKMKKNVVVIFDASRSMNETFSGEKKNRYC